MCYGVIFALWKGVNLAHLLLLLYHHHHLDFIIQKKKYKKINIGNLKTIISNKKIKQTVSGNTGAVYISPLNSLRFVLNKLKKDKVDLNKDFYVFTGSTVGVVPILGKGLYSGKVDKLGSAKAIIH